MSILPKLTELRNSTSAAIMTPGDALMYKQYWGFDKTPFPESGAGESFFQSAVHEEALARLQYLNDNENRLGLLIGGTGTGKTTVFHHWANLLRRRGVQVAVLSLLGIQPDEFVWQLADAINVRVDASRPVSFAWRQIFDQVMVNRFQFVDTVILFDDGHEAPHDVLTSVVRLTQWKPSEESRLTLALACDEQRTALLGRRLLDLPGLRIDLAAWQHEDTAAYLQTALKLAGREEPVFEIRAIEMIQQLSEGIPRRIRQLAELSLLAGAGERVTLIDANMVQHVDEELAASGLARVA